MRQIVYESVASVEICKRDLDQILAKSVANNPESGLTGVLLQRGQRFIQALEGDEPALERTLQRIASDPHHHDVNFLFNGESDCCDFSKSSMMLIGDDPETQRIQSWFWPKGDIDTTKMTDEDVLEFLKLSSVVACLDAWGVPYIDL